MAIDNLSSFKKMLSDENNEDLKFKAQEIAAQYIGEAAQRGVQMTLDDAYSLSAVRLHVLTGEREGREERVDHRSLADQREAALERGDELATAELDREPEIKLGPATNAMERRAMQEAERDGVDYAPVTERGAQNHQIRQQRDFLADLRQRAELAREAYTQAREHDASRLSAAVDAARAMFSNTAASQKFGEGFEAAIQKEDEARQRFAPRPL